MTKPYSCGRCGMKFAIAQEISRHVRDKLCKFFSTNRTEQSTTCTITSNEEAQTQGAAENAETSTSHSSIKTFALITPDSIKYPSMNMENDDDKVPALESVEEKMEVVSESVVEAEKDDNEESPSQGIDLIENNFSEILSPSEFQIRHTNETDEDNEFGMIIGEMDNKIEQIVEILFTCKLCEFR